MSIVAESISESEINQLYEVGNDFAILFYDESVKAWKYKVGSDLSFRTFSTGVTPEEVQDIVGQFVAGANGVDVTYDDANNVLILEINQLTLGLIQNALQPGANISSLNNDSGYQTVSQVNNISSQKVSDHEGLSDPHPQYTTQAEAASVAPVQSVNGQVGDVVTGFAKFINFFSS